MLTIEVLAKFGESHRGEALFVERIMIAAAQKPIKTEDEQRFNPSIVRSTHIRNVTGQFARRRIALSAQAPNPLDLSLAHRNVILTLACS